MEVKIKDTAFAHTDYSTLQKGKYFKWVRINDSKDVCFFTDDSLSLVHQSNDRIKVAWLIEPRAIKPNSYDFVERFSHLFDYILTYDEILLNYSNKFLFYPHGGCWLNDEDKFIYDKSKFCSIIASPKNITSGHRLRHEIISSLNDTIDSYGESYVKINNKIEALKDYKFSIVVENSKQETYFTEKLIDTLLTGTVPLYWGTDRVNNYFNNIPTFNTIDELHQLIKYYIINEYPIEDIKNNFDKALMYTIPEDYIFQHYNFLFK